MNEKTHTRNASLTEHTVIGSKGDKYTVTRPMVLTENWTCTCPHFFHRQTECKHIREVKTKLGIR
jgi:uncharacterized Zn finger protein